jgi:hypothetical protein
LTVLTEKFETVLTIELGESHKKSRISPFAMNSKGGSHNMVANEANLQEFIGKAVNEWGAAEGALITFVSDRLGLFISRVN